MTCSTSTRRMKVRLYIKTLSFGSESLTGILIAREANETPDAVYELLDAIPMFWKHQEVPVEHALTT